MEHLVTGLVTWCVERGAQGSGLAVRDAGPRGRGLVATRPVAPGEVVLSVPLDLCAFADDDAPRPDLLPDALKELAQVPWWARLACRLLYERALGSASEYAPYLALVPTELTTTPLVDDEAIQFLTACYPPGGQKCEALRNAVAAAFAFLCTSTHSAALLSGASYEQFRTAVAVVHSRCYGYPDYERRRWVRIMVPLADIANHGGDRGLPPPNVMWRPIADDGNLRWDVHEGCLLLSATRNLQPGEEALFSYREQSNDQFLLYYGFIPGDNPHDDLVLFDDVDDMIAWWREAYHHPGQSDASLEARIRAARAAAATVETDVRAGDGADMLDDAGVNTRQFKALAGLREDVRLTASMGACFGGNERAAQEAVARRRAEIRDALQAALESPGLSSVVKDYLLHKSRIANEPFGIPNPPTEEDAAWWRDRR
jgi:SET domain